MSDVRILATGLGFPEGPVVMPDGSVILTEIRNGRCSRITPDGKVACSRPTAAGPTASRSGPTARSIAATTAAAAMSRACRWGRGRIPTTRAAPSSGSTARPARPRRSTPNATATSSRAPNDLVFDKAGGFYFTDLGKRYARHRDHGGLYYALPDGSKIVCLAYPMLSPNGCGLSPDGKMLYVADTEGAGSGHSTSRGRACCASPRVTRRMAAGCIAGSAGPARFDSLAVMANGNIAVATLTTGKITEFSPDGAIVREDKMPDIYPTNICFGGADMRTAYITLSDLGRLGTMTWPKPGLKLNFN